MDVEFLSRVQFALTSMFHYIYPPMSIGLGVVLVIMEGWYLKTRDASMKIATQFWTKIFALTFCLGVATGLVQVFGFGTNWAGYSRFVGDVFGSALGAEGVFAFVAEAGFLGIMLFGWNRVSPKVHYLATVIVCLAAHFSSVWIVCANSWMQTPQGYCLVESSSGLKAQITNFWEMVFNPSFLDRIRHVVVGCWLVGAFLVLSVAAYYLLKKKYETFAKRCFLVALIMGWISIVLQAFSGHESAMTVSRYQPEKLASMEGVFHTTDEAPLYLFGIVNEEEKAIQYSLKIPKMLSFLVGGRVAGLEEYPQGDTPPLKIVFYSYHLMIMFWGCMLGTLIIATVLYKKKKWKQHPRLLKIMVVSVVFPQIANQLGWCVAEVGRQPWVVYGLLKTSDGLSKMIQPQQVLGSLTMFCVVYVFLFALFIYLLHVKIQEGPYKESEMLYKSHEIL